MSRPAVTDADSQRRDDELRTAVLLRHGRTAWNAQHRFQGQLDVPLDPVGVQQATAAAAVLRDTCRPEPTAIVSSDLGRAVATATAAADACGLTVVCDPALREAHAGTWQGRTHDELASDDAELLHRWRTNADVRPGGTGETRVEVATRVAAAIERQLTAQPPSSSAIFVTHGGAARAVVGHFLGLPAADWGQLAVLDNCSWAVVQRIGNRAAPPRWRLAAYNVAAHLSGVASRTDGAPDGMV